jgi:hypothetical protein
MADSNRSVAIVAVIAILIMVGLAIYFVAEETNDDIEIDLGLQETRLLDVSASEAALRPPPGFALAG